ncbi:transglycosylase domain-containing protein [Umezawaea sp. Da 62-37]|uniref:transglycosylase domain-containing protein n=1 Tax=Umezawaea sp. Da 62-37 TaxID=3075927 RepID=UPI0028F6FB69|nr:transglycosylase domain-containing protein [Umezawaea sp. Da 62-37]WNV91361.1 transglycosylase domain-containing protein [Umezawaea sp. Da 62-37]
MPPGGARPGARGGPAGPPAHNKADELTDLLQPVQPPMKREPDLLTHREPDEPSMFLEEDAYDEFDSEELSEEEERAVRKKKIWRRVRRISYIAAGLMVLTPLVAFAIAYQLVDVPDPAVVAEDQQKAVTILYSDGSEMAKISPQGSNRELLAVDDPDLTDDVKHAVFAAEDATFETNPGFDFVGIARAAWFQVSGGEGGGSGLTQQYVKKATEKEDPTLSRKFTEVVKAYKMSNQKSKGEILAAYLNTIYQGRSAFGIKAAAQMYYGKEVQDLTASEAALIAGMIQNPSRSEEEKYPVDRWKFVMGQMLDKGWITQEYYDTQTYPTLKPLAEVQQNALEGVRAHIQVQVEAEMAGEEIDMDEEEALKKGVTIHTSIDPRMQTAAEEAVSEVMEGQPEVLRQSLTAIEPSTGAVRAYWAGNDGVGIDYNKGTLQEPGSSFKPFDLVAALQQGEGVGEVYDGSSPRTFPGRETNPVKNAQGVACAVPKQCSVREAMVKSVNTVFYDMAVNNVGTSKVAKAAYEAGIPEEVTIGDEVHKLLKGEDGGDTPDGNIAIGGGQTLVRPFDMTSAYATFAARGVYHEPFFIEKIEGPDGKLLYQHADKSRSAFDENPEKSGQIADNVTDVLKDIPKASTKTICAEGRECAGKTGTHELDGVDNSKAWMVGYTPSLAAGVYMGTEAGNVPLRNAGDTPIFGSGLPGQIWKAFMDKALAGTPKDTFPKADMIGQAVPPAPSTPKTTTPPPKTSEKTETSEPEDDKSETPEPPTGTSTSTKNPPGGNPGCLPLQPNCPPTGTSTSTKTNGQGNGGGGGAGTEARDPNDP